MGTRLIFDEEELGKFEEYKPERSYHLAYQAGYEDGREKAWNAANKMFDMDKADFNAVFGEEWNTKAFLTMFKTFSAAEAIAKIKEYEDKKAFERNEGHLTVKVIL